jgi:hypothetical protein
MPRERYKLDLVGFLPGIYVNDDPNITRLEAVIGKERP